MKLRAPRDRDDAGFSLVEVVIAVVLLGLVTTAVLPFFVNSISKSAALQHRQSGVAVASSAMEGARAVVATQQKLGGVNVTGLVRGRGQAEVEAQWAGLPAAVTATTTPRWDPDSTSAPDNPNVPGTKQAVPLQRTDTVGTLAYTSDVLIGTCWRVRATPSAACAASGPGAPPADEVELVRIVVITRWAPLDGASTEAGCGAGCSYRLVSLVDPTVDPTWPTGAGEVVDDLGTITIPDQQEQASMDFAVLDNDLVTYTASSPVEVLASSVVAPTQVQTLPGGVVRVTVTRDSPMPTLVRYRVRNSSGGVTQVATINIIVLVEGTAP